MKAKARKNNEYVFWRFSHSNYLEKRLKVPCIYFSKQAFNAKKIPALIYG